MQEGGEVGGTSQWLRALAAPLGDLALNSSTRTVAKNQL